jgi:hypothetical protein
MLHTIYSFVGSTVFDDFVPARTGMDAPEITVPMFSGLATGASFLFGFGHTKPQVYLMGAGIGAAASCAYFFYGSVVYNTVFGVKKSRR